MELQLSYPAAYRRTLLRRAALVAGWSGAFAAISAAAVQLAGLWAPGLARSFAGHRALRPFYLFATSRPGPDPGAYGPNRLSLLLVAPSPPSLDGCCWAVRRGCCRACSPTVHPAMAPSMAAAEMPALLGSAACEYRMLIRAWWLWAAIAVAGIAGGLDDPNRVRLRCAD